MMFSNMLNVIILKVVDEKVELFVNEFSKINVKNIKEVKEILWRGYVI